MTTFYLKYRPQKISELDLFNVRKQLSDIVSSGKIPHAFLFAGPKGSGKTSAARILAKAVNCEKNEKRKTKNDYEPCNKCNQCISVTKGSNLDVVEIDAASNRGVDDVRALRETVKLATAAAAKKVYIVDEAHMLTVEAANALLKTLEEPPDHVIFILATTTPEKLPDTIRSRCMTVNFARATPDEVMQALQKAVDGEGLEAGQEALAEIAKNVDGSFREAHKLLEQLSFTGKRIEIQKVEELFALAGSRPEELLECMAAGQVKGALELLDRFVQTGVNLRLYTSQVIGVLRMVLLCELGLAKRVAFTAGTFGGVSRVQEAIELFSQAYTQIPTAVLPQLPLEMVVVKWGVGVEGSQPAHARDQKSDVPLHSPAVGGATPASEPDPQIGSRPRTERSSGTGASPPVSGEGLEESWKKIMQKVKATNHSIEALLRATKPQGLNGNKLVLEVFYQFHKERIEKDPYRSVVEKIVQEVLGTQIQVLCLLSSSKKKAVDIANITEGVEEDIVRAAEEIFAGDDAGKLAN